MHPACRGRPPCLPVKLRYIGMQVARYCSGRHGSLPLPSIVLDPTEYVSRPKRALHTTKESTALEPTEYCSIYVRSNALYGTEQCSLWYRAVLPMVRSTALPRVGATLTCNQGSKTVCSITCKQVCSCYTSCRLTEVYQMCTRCVPERKSLIFK